MDDMQMFRQDIRVRFGSEARFAYSLGWNRQYLNRILNRQRIPDINDVSAMAKGLRMSISKVASIFLREESPNGDKKEKT